MPDMEKKKYDVTALGEVLIDFTYSGTNNDGKNCTRRTQAVRPPTASAPSPSSEAGEPSSG